MTESIAFLIVDLLLHRTTGECIIEGDVLFGIIPISSFWIELKFVILCVITSLLVLLYGLPLVALCLIVLIVILIPLGLIPVTFQLLQFLDSLNILQAL